jgi:hypothetical protein
MRSRALLPLSASLLMLTALCVWAEPKVKSFADRDWTIDLPADYKFEKTASPTDESFSVTFFPKGRTDKTRPLVQVTLYNANDNGRSAAFAPQFAAAMIAGVQKNKKEWKVTTSTEKIAEYTVTRYAWSGVTGTVPARGVMLVGADKGLGFALHVQDVAAYADKTLPAGEKALRTFRMN